MEKIFIITTETIGKMRIANGTAWNLTCLLFIVNKGISTKMTDLET